MEHSLLHMATRLEGLIDTSDITPAANNFLRQWVPLVKARSKTGLPVNMTEKQEDWFRGLYEQHFE